MALGVLLFLVGVNYSSFRDQLWLFKNAVLEDSVYVDTLQNGDVAYFSVSPRVQTRVFEIYDNWRPPYGVLVAVEPATGRVLSLVGYNKKNPTHPWNKNLALKNTFPAASLFKIITALAAVRKLGLLPEDSVIYRGKLHSSKPRIWLKSRYVHKTTFAKAFGMSNNPAFGLLAKKLGEETLLETAKGLGFVDGNKGAGALARDLSWGKVSKPKDKYDLMLTGAGFTNSTLSPLHGALIAASVINDGVMMKPTLMDSVIGRDGQVVWRSKPETLRSVMKGPEAGIIKELMMTTVACGTSYRAFFDENGNPVMDGLMAGGKTGTLTGKDPPGRCEWFVGFGQDNKRAIAVASLVINRTRRRNRLKGSYPAEEAMEAYMGVQGLVPMCAVGKPVEKRRR